MAATHMSAFCVALIQIRARRPGIRYLIVTDSMGSLRALQTRKVAPRTNSLVYEINQLTDDAVENRMEWHTPVRPSQFLPLSRITLLEGRQSGWDSSDMGGYAYSFWPVVSFMPSFRRFKGD
jgi:hypothetical protein